MKMKTKLVKAQEEDMLLYKDIRTGGLYRFTDTGPKRNEILMKTNELAKNGMGFISIQLNTGRGYHLPMDTPVIEVKTLEDIIKYVDVEED